KRSRPGNVLSRESAPAAELTCPCLYSMFPVETDRNGCSPVPPTAPCLSARNGPLGSPGWMLSAHPANVLDSLDTKDAAVMLTTDLGACEWFVWDLRRSNLLDRGQLDQVVGEFLEKNPRAEPAALSEYLVNQGILTPFQAERLLQGKTQGF